MKRHTKRCRGVVHDETRTLDSGHILRYRQCGQCWRWLPLGPSDEKPVRVEVRAATLAAAWKPKGGVRGLITEAESDGWREHVRPDSDAYQAGFLANAILNHDTEQRFIEMTGQPPNWAPSIDPRERTKETP